MMEILIISLLILLNGLFSMSEIAVVSARKSKLKTEARQGSKSAKAALDLAEKPDKFLSTVQIGITLIGILTGIYSGDTLAGDFAVFLSASGMSATYAPTVAQTLIVVIVTYFSIIFGELVPKRIALAVAGKVAKIIAKPMKFLSTVTTPFVWILSQSSYFIFSILNIKTSANKITEEEIKSMIKESASEGEVQVVEQDIVERVFTLGDRTIDSIMTHRSEIAWIDKSMTNSQIREYIAANLFNKYPVADKTLNDIIGIVYLKDLFGKLDLLDFSLEKVIRPALIFHDNMDVYKALEELRKKNSQYALIYDEFGSFQGVVTLKDVLEALIGFIPDDGDDPEIVERSGNDGWFVDGQCSFYDFLDYFGMEDLYPKYEYNTVSGLVLDELEHIPQTGEKFEWNRLIVEIADMDGARIDKLIIRKN